MILTLDFPPDFPHIDDHIDQVRLGSDRIPRLMGPPGSTQRGDQDELWWLTFKEKESLIPGCLAYSSLGQGKPRASVVTDLVVPLRLLKGVKHELVIRGLT